MARKGNPARLVVALSVAAVLAVFLLYTSIAGNATPSIQPSALAGRADSVQLTGKVVRGSITGDAASKDGLRFVLRDLEGPSKARVAVVYTGTVPPQFKDDRHLVVTGKLVGGTFVADRGSMITKCPSKFSAKEPKVTER